MGRARQLADGGINDAILMDASAADTDVNDNILLNATDSDSTDAGFNLLYENGTHDGSALLTNTHLADMVSPVRSAGRTIIIPDVSEPIRTDDDSNIQQFQGTTDLVPSTGGAAQTYVLWREMDGRGQGNKNSPNGALVSQSSGIWSFAKTGYYSVNYQVFMAAHTVTYAGGILQFALDGSTYATIAENYSSVTSTSGTYYKNANPHVVLKITNPEVERMKTNIYSSHTSITFAGNSTQGISYLTCTFQRIGDL